MFIGYNTNGFAFHDSLEAIRLLAEIGYRSVALSIDHQLLKPGFSHLKRQIKQIGDLLSDYQMSSVIETGARYLLNPKIKHEPTLVSSNKKQRQQRIDFLMHAIDMADQLGSDCVSLWSGILRDDIDEEEGFRRLVDSLEVVVAYAEQKNVVLGFEPEPGMFINRMQRFQRLTTMIDSPQLKLTMDIGHLHCQGEVPISDYLNDWSSEIVNIHIEDMRAGVHEHLMFGEGEIDFPPILKTLKQIGYQGGLHVELSRHSHGAPQTAQAAYDFLNPLL